MSHKILKLSLTLALVLIISACNVTTPETDSGAIALNQTTENVKKTKLDFYIMSQCPYGTQVEDAIAPVMQKMSNVIDLNIEYILYSQENYAEQEAMYCVDDLCSMHGIPEVNGNIVQLCVEETNPTKSLDFIVCQNKDANNIPENWEKCAEELKLDKEKIQTCYEGEEGKKLLRESSKLAEAVNAQGSPTIYLDDKQYQEGRTSLDFQRAICQAIDNEHTECENLPICGLDTDCTAEAEKVGKCVNPGTKEAVCEYTEAQPINLVVLSDARCTLPECATENVLQQIKQSFKGIENIQELDYSAEEGQALYVANGLQTLPAYLFEKEVETAYFYNELKGYLQPKGDYYELAVGSTFNPTKEICDNKVDDTNNGLTDCADEDCANTLICREEEKGRLDLFVMSQCPYGTQALDIMPTILEAFNDEISFNVNFIASELEPGKFNSLHGQPEVDENIRELCAIKEAPESYKYMDYILCRNKNISSTEWENCSTEAGLNINAMKTCSTGEEGINLHSENIKLANGLGIGASPTWLANNKYQFSGIDAQTIQTEICKYNPELKGCSVNLSGAETAAAIPAGSCN